MEENSNDVDLDTRREGYQIVCKKLNTLPVVNLTEEEQMAIARTLSPAPPRQQRHIQRAPQEGIYCFAKEQLRQAVKKLKQGKAPVPDRLPREVGKAIVQGLCVDFMNMLLLEGKFPFGRKKE